MELERFDGRGDFHMWQKKMKKVLVQHRCAKALVQKESKEISAKITAQEEQHLDMNKLAFSLLILNLSDNVLRQVNEKETAAKVWSKLESLYMTKSLSNKIYLKE